MSLTPEEKAHRRLAAQRQAQLEKEAMLREEHERQEAKRREKLEQERLEREEEEKRKAVLQEELRAAALRKARLEREEREIEEQRLQELRERKQLEKERRIQYTKEMERWRAEQMQRVESQCSEKEEERRRSVEGRRMRIARINEEVFSDSKADKMAGWVTVQPPDMLAWKRRYYKFELGHAESKMLLYGNPREVDKPLDVLPLDGQIESLAEWYEGFEELEAIPHSFALRFIDGVEWRMFADSAEEKDRLLVLLSEAAGIIL
jgi:ssDNA-binding Zn-finger/Zn-ribbon topoisomerase 1